MLERNHYEVLGASKASGADELHACYLEKLQQVHPDRNVGDDEASHERTIEVVAAYRALSDPVARKRYDFRCGNPFRTDGELPGFKLMKTKAAADAEAFFTQAARHIKGDDLLKSVEPLKAALGLKPAYPAATYNLALAGALMGNGNFALGVLAEGIRRSPNDLALQRLRKDVLSTFMTV